MGYKDPTISANVHVTPEVQIYMTKFGGYKITEDGDLDWAGEPWTVVGIGDQGGGPKVSIMIKNVEDANRLSDIARSAGYYIQDQNSRFFAHKQAEMEMEDDLRYARARAEEDD